jgi:hypothetical protein
MTERHLIAYAIVIILLLAAAIVWRRSRRTRRAPEPHLRIDLVSGDPEEPGRTGS